MTVLSASATAGLLFKCKADSSSFPGGAGILRTGTATIGDAIATLYPAADVAYVVEITADDAADVALLTCDTGERIGTTGNPVFVPATAIDSFGVALPEMDTLYSIRITANAENSDPIALEGATDTGSIDVPLLAPGQEILSKFPAAGVTMIGSIEFTFGAAGDSVTVEIIASATPA